VLADPTAPRARHWAGRERNRNRWGASGRSSRDCGRTIVMVHESTKAERRAARERVSSYYDAELATLVEQVERAIARHRAGEIDVRDVDELIHRYSKAARNCGSSAGRGARAPISSSSLARSNSGPPKPIRSTGGRRRSGLAGTDKRHARRVSGGPLSAVGKRPRGARPPRRSRPRWSTNAARTKSGRFAGRSNKCTPRAWLSERFPAYAAYRAATPRRFVPWLY
jgi:hypothetical protein